MVLRKRREKYSTRNIRSGVNGDIHMRRQWLQIRIQGKHRSMYDDVVHFAVVPILAGLVVSNGSAGLVCLVGGFASTTLLLGNKTQQAMIEWFGHFPVAVIQPYLNQWYDNLLLPLVRIGSPDALTSKAYKVAEEIRIQQQVNILNKLRKDGVNPNMSLTECIASSFGNITTQMFFFGAGATFVFLYWRRETERDGLLAELDDTFTDPSVRPIHHISRRTTNTDIVLLTEDAAEDDSEPGPAALSSAVVPSESSHAAATVWNYAYGGAKVVATFLYGPFARLFLP